MRIEARTQNRHFPRKAIRVGVDDAGNGLDVIEFYEYRELYLAGEFVGKFGDGRPLAQPIVIAGVPYRWLYRGGSSGIGVVQPGAPGRLTEDLELVAGDSPYGGQRLRLRHWESE